jgi:hypothetical protein
MFKSDSLILGTVQLDNSVKRDLEQQWTDWKLQMTRDFKFKVLNRDSPYQDEGLLEQYKDYSTGEEDIGTISVMTRPLVL